MNQKFIGKKQDGYEEKIQLLKKYINMLQCFPTYWLRIIQSWLSFILHVVLVLVLALELVLVLVLTLTMVLDVILVQALDIILVLL